MSTDHVGKALATATVNLPHIVIQLARASDRAGPSRLPRLYEAQRLGHDLVASIDAAIRAETQAAAEQAVPLIAAQIRAAAGGRK